MTNQDETELAGTRHYDVILNSSNAVTASADHTFVIQESIGYLLAANARLVQRDMTACLAQLGVAHAQWSIMLALWAGDGLTQRDLSRRVAIEEATLARALVRMEKEGLVRRERDRADGRQMLVFLTEKSERLQDQLIPIAFSVQEQATASLSESERATLASLLQKMLGSNRRYDAGGSNPDSD